MHSFKLSFDSQSGDPYAYDMRATLKAKGETRVAPLQAGLYSPTEMASGSVSVCDGTAAVALDADAAMVFITVDDRPDMPFVIGLVIDAKDRRVLTPQVLGRTGKPLEVQPTLVRMLAMQAKNTKVKSNSSPDGFFFAWRSFSLNGRELRASWETPIPKGAKPVTPPAFISR
jgi:hypothetical protein